MQFNVAQLLKEPTGATRQYELNENLEGLDKELRAARAIGRCAAPCCAPTAASWPLVS